MDKTISALALNSVSGKTLIFEVELPKICPICQVAVEAKILSSYFSCENFVKKPNLFVTYFCSACELAFLGYYHATKYGNSDLINFEPQSDLEQREFSKNIQELSPNFCKIYNQAYAAQQKGLDDICGISYRKALEFLIKDYVIHLHPEDEDKIIGMMLSPCIQNYIDNQRIKKLATASAWIGNDETHYSRKHEDYNVKDLLAFIDAIETFINADLSAFEAEKLINNSKKGGA